MTELELKFRKEAPPMPKQAPEVRRSNFGEVALGYTEEQAVVEAKRCLKCPKAPCVNGCPLEVDIPAFVKLVAEGKFAEAAGKVREKNSFPAICGRVCLQEEQCEISCASEISEPVRIGRLERFVADRERENGLDKPERATSTGKKVAVVGSGPAGLTVAAELARLGHDVVVFEALHVPGGVLVYGIPEFRLPRNVVEAEIGFVKNLGVEFRLGNLVGRFCTIPELLKKGFDSVFIGTGVSIPKFLGLPGESLGGVYSASEFLIRLNLMRAHAFPEYDTPIRIGKKVMVVGGGNVAMDCARSALRLGAEQVCIVYRHSKEEMLARHEEVKNAEEEGITCKFLAAPVRFIGDMKGWVKAMEFISMELESTGKSGKRSPVPVEGSEFTIETDTVIVAVGRLPNPIVHSTTKGLEAGKEGTIAVDENGRTSLEGVYAGGDIVTGEASIVSAMGAGKKAARAIHEYLMKKS